MATGLVIQARAGSQRLPNKIFLDLPFGSGVTVLERVVAICQRVRTADAVIVATTMERIDDRTTELAEGAGAIIFRGPTHNVLERYVGAADTYTLDTIVRVTADCPCHDALIIEQALSSFSSAGVDYLSNTRTRSFPRGFDVEVFTATALRRASRNCVDIYQREHVTPPLYSGEGFSQAVFECPGDVPARPDLRVTLDVPSDYALLNLIYDALGSSFGLSDVVSLFQRFPWLMEVNRQVEQRKVFSSMEDELEAAALLLEKHAMARAKQKLLGPEPSCAR